MARLINLGVAVVSQMAVDDGNGNAFPLQVEPIPILQPSREAFLDAWEQYEERWTRMSAIPEEKVAELVAEAKQRVRPGSQPSPPANRQERRQAARETVKQASKAPTNGKSPETAAKTVEVVKE